MNDLEKKKQEAVKYRTLDAKLAWVIAEARAIQQTYKAEIEDCEDAEIDIEAGLTSLEDALKALNSRAEEEDGDSHEQHMRFECRKGNFV